MIGRRTFITLVGGVTARSHRGRPGRIPYVERLIGTVRRECLDHVLIVGERHLRRILALYSSYYNESRTHWMRRYNELSRDAERSSAHQFFPDYTIAMRGYDFRERQAFFAEPLPGAALAFL